jgi:pimeloyl-ACP methyl ester carboxylesterase
LHPANDGSRDHFLFLHLAKVLPPRGIAVARFDRRNAGERFAVGGDDVPFDAQVEDAMRVVSELEHDPRIDRARIGLWGYSQGAWVAPLAASRSSKISFLVLVASTGVSPSQQMLYGTARHARLAGFGEDAARRIVAVRRVIDEHRRGRATFAEAQAAIHSIRTEPFFEHAWMPADLEGVDLTWRDMDFDPEPIFAGVSVPTLLFYGEDDEWSPIDASVASWRRAAERSGNPDVTVVRVAGTGHEPTRGGTGRIDDIAPEYERTLLAWLGRVTRVD